MLTARALSPDDLAWQQGMPDWKALREIPSFTSPAISSNLAPQNPYSSPHSDLEEPEPVTCDSLDEIEPGTVPLDVYGCISRAWELTKEHFAFILLCGLVCLGVYAATEIPMGMIETMLGGGQKTVYLQPNIYINYPTAVGAVHQILSQIISIFLSLGMTRIALNLISGKPASIGMIFGEGPKLLRAIGASILYGLMVAVGLLFLIIPGIYLALRFGQFQSAIVDRDLGVLESLRYSSRITAGNRPNLLLLAILSGLIVLLGVLALLVGLIVAIPVTWLTSIVAYRWLQYGRRILKVEPPL